MNSLEQENNDTQAVLFIQQIERLFCFHYIFHFNGINVENVYESEQKSQTLF